MSTTLSPSGLVAPAVTDEVPDTIAALAANFRWLNDYLHPVGTIAYFTNSFDPNAHWGGTWVEDTSGRTDVASSSAHPAGSTWGSETHQLKSSELPAKIGFLGVNDGAAMTDEPGTYAPKIYQDKKINWNGNFTVPDGGNAMSLAQPSTAVHKWVRTA